MIKFTPRSIITGESTERNYRIETLTVIAIDNERLVYFHKSVR